MCLAFCYCLHFCQSTIILEGLRIQNTSKSLNKLYLILLTNKLCNCFFCLFFFQKKLQEQLAIEEEKRRKEAEERLREDEAFARKLQSEAEQQWMQEQEDKYKRLQQQEEERLATEKRRKEEEASGSGGILLIPADISGNVPSPVVAPASAPVPAPRTVTPGVADQSVASSTSVPAIPDRELKKYLNLNDQRYSSVLTNSEEQAVVFCVFGDWLGQVLVFTRSCLPVLHIFLHSFHYLFVSLLAFQRKSARHNFRNLAEEQQTVLYPLLSDHDF